jgi:putative sigma-54 modulation protein
MKINIKTTTISLTPAISDYVDKRFSSLDKFFQNDSTVMFDLELAKTTNHHKNGDIFKAEIHITGKDKNIYASSEKEDLYAAIDDVKDEILREVKNSNEKIRSLLRRGGAKIKNLLRMGK